MRSDGDLSTKNWFLPQAVNFQFSARFEKNFVPLNPVNFLPFYALAFLSVYIKIQFL